MAAGAQIHAAVMRSMLKQQSMQSQMQKMKRGEMPDDLGRMPEILIKPPSKELPAFFSKFWRRRIRIEWTTLRQRFSDFVAYAIPTLT